jgi:hypothetical protein
MALKASSSSSSSSSKPKKRVNVALEDARRSQAQRDGDAILYLAGMSNKGIQFRPAWNSTATAARWITKQRAGKQGKLYADWDVVDEDLDDNPNTPNNVVVYSDYPRDIIKSVDGYYLAGPKKKQTLRGYYTNYPVKDVRSQLSTDPEVKKTIKSYFSNYQTPNESKEKPIETYERYIPVFQRIREVVTEIFKNHGVKVHTAKSVGNIVLENYMRLVLKMSKRVREI